MNKIHTPPQAVSPLRVTPTSWSASIPPTLKRALQNKVILKNPLSLKRHPLFQRGTYLGFVSFLVLFLKKSFLQQSLKRELIIAIFLKSPLERGVCEADGVCINFNVSLKFAKLLIF